VPSPQASILHYAKEITQAQAGFLVLDTVIAVPSFFSQSQRQAVIDAAGLAGLNVLGLINSHSAAALQFGIERNFENNTQTVVLYDIGSGSTEVTLVKYSTYSVKEGGRPKVYSQFEIKDAEWDSELGGNSLDALLVSHFGKVFMQKHPKATDIFQNPKSMAKLKKQVSGAAAAGGGRRQRSAAASTAASTAAAALAAGGRGSGSRHWQRWQLGGSSSSSSSSA
jgi:hypoxia up-regulated 1